jgi:hypothetical protein
MEKSLTWGELYEKVQKETELAKQPLNEYKKSRKTFSQLFEEANCEESECKEEEQLQENVTYSNLYEQYLQEQNPITEQEAIYIIGKLDSGEKLTESELQKLEEFGSNPVGWNPWRAATSALGFNTKGNQAYQMARKQGSQLAKQRKQAQVAAIANQKYGGAMIDAQQQMNQLNAANNNSAFNSQGKFNKDAQKDPNDTSDSKDAGAGGFGAATDQISDQAQAGQNAMDNAEGLIKAINDLVAKKPKEKANVEQSIKKANGNIQHLQNILDSLKN